MIRRFFKNIIGKCIELIEKIEYKNIKLDENDPSKKILKSFSIKNLYVEADNIDSPISEVHITQPYAVYRFELQYGYEIECADNHIVYDEYMNAIYAQHVNAGDYLMTDMGPLMVLHAEKLPFKVSMYDVTVNSPSHRYMANGILSHNTTTISAFMAWMIVFHADRNILIVANKEKTAIEIVDKITNIFKGLPFFLKPGCINFGKSSIALDNGSKIISSATTNTASIGFTIHCMLLDEFAHIPDNIVNNFWRSVYPTLSSSMVSQCIITSTPNGTTNKFYEIWSNAIEKKNSFIPIRTDYWEVPGHDNEWAEQMKLDFGEEEFAQEFELQFNINSKMLLKANDLQYANRLKVTYIYKPLYSASDNDLLRDENIVWHPNFDPNDISENDKFVFLIDLAEGNSEMYTQKNTKKQPDFNTINILKVVPTSIANLNKYSRISCLPKDCFRFVQVGVYTSNEEDECYCGKIASALAYDVFKDHMYDNVRIMVEMNFNGKAFIENMQKHAEYTDSTVQRTYHTKPTPGEKQRRRLGFKTTSNKEYFCLKGAKLISMHRIVMNEERTINQAQAFGYVKGHLKGIACKDDLSMPIFNHIPRMLDDSTFTEWLENYLDSLPDEMQRYRFNLILERHAMDNPETSDAQFNAMYGTGRSSIELATGNIGYGGFNGGFNPYSTISSVGSYSDLMSKYTAIK